MTSDATRTESLWGKWQLFALVVFLTAALRVIVALSPQAIHVDGAIQYLPAAQVYYDQGLSAGLAASIEMPLLPVSIALLTAVTHDLELSARILSLLAGIITVIPLYYLVRNFFGPKRAFVAALLFAVCPLFVRNSSEVTKESLFGMFFVLGMWLGWLAISRRQIWMCLIAGIVGALAYMTRPDGLDLFVVWCAWLGLGFIYYLLRDRKQALARLAAAIVIALPTLALGGAYVAYIHHTRGIWTLSPKKPLDRMIAGREQSAAAPKGRNQPPATGPSAPVQVTAATPKVKPPSLPKRVGLFLGRTVVSFGEVCRELFNEMGPMFLLMVILAFAMRRGAVFRGDERYLLMLCTVQLAICMLIVIHFSVFRGLKLIDSDFSGRHILSLILVLWCWIGWGLAPLARGTAWLMKKAGRAVTPESPVLAATLLSVICAGTLPMALRAPHTDKLADKPAGIWLLAQKEKTADLKLMTNDRRICWYAKIPVHSMIEYTRTWATKFKPEITKAIKERVTYLCLSTGELAKVRNVVDAAVKDRKLSLAYQTSLKKNENVFIFEVVREKSPPAQPAVP